MVSQLRKDLDNRIYERLVQWSLDSIELYRMGGLRQHEAGQDIFVNLMLMMCKVGVAHHIKPEDLSKPIKNTMERLEADLELFHARRKEQNDE